MKHAATILLLLLIAGCSAPPSPTAPNTARADEMVLSHAREQEANIDAAREAATVLNIPGTLAILDRIHGRLREFSVAIANLIAKIEAQSRSLSEEVTRLRSESYRAYRTMALVGAIIMAAGVAGLFWVWSRPFAPIALVGGGSLVAVGISLQVIAPWLPWVGVGVTAACAAIIIWTVYTYRRDIVSIVKPADILKMESQNIEAVEEVYSSKESIANKMQSPATKRLVAAARKAAPAKPLTKEAP